MHVRHVEYMENGSEILTGTLYMTTFRVVFAPEREPNQNDLVNPIIDTDFIRYSL